jgi:hypothetical protein
MELNMLRYNGASDIYDYLIADGIWVDICTDTNYHISGVIEREFNSVIVIKTHSGHQMIYESHIVAVVPQGVIDTKTGETNYE